MGFGGSIDRRAIVTFTPNGTITWSDVRLPKAADRTIRIIGRGTVSGNVIEVTIDQFHGTFDPNLLTSPSGYVTNQTKSEVKLIKLSGPDAVTLNGSTVKLFTQNSGLRYIFFSIDVAGTGHDQAVKLFVPHLRRVEDAEKLLIGQSEVGQDERQGSNP